MSDMSQKTRMKGATNFKKAVPVRKHSKLASDIKQST